MCKKIIDSKIIENIIKLSEEFHNKKLEILILPFYEKENHEFNPDDFSGIFALDDIESEVKHIRDEWERF